MEWRPVVGFEDYYQVSATGLVLSQPRPRTPGGILRPWIHVGRYYAVWLRGGGQNRKALVHAVVAEAFLGPRPPGQQVRHLNCDSLDNRVENLSYGTYWDNMQDAIRNGKTAAARTHCKHGHEFTDENTRRRVQDGYTVRDCLACEKRRNDARH